MWRAFPCTQVHISDSVVSQLHTFFSFVQSDIQPVNSSCDKHSECFPAFSWQQQIEGIMSSDSASNLDIKTELERLKSELAISEKLGEKARQRQLELEESNAKLKDEILVLKENVGNTKKMEDVIAGLKKELRI